MKRPQCVAVLAGMILVPSLFADQVSTVGGYGPYQTGSGGEFTLLMGSGMGSYSSYYDAVAKGFVGGDTIQSFCVEGSEYIYANTTFDVTTAQSTKFTGTTLPVGAAWLYAAFASGQLSYNYGAGRSTSADQLQRTIWALVGQEGQTAANTATDPYTILVTSHFGSWANALVANGTQYPVAVLRLWAVGGADTYDGRRQDQLILTGTPGNNIVPDGGLTVALLGMALTGLAAFRRRVQLG